MDTPSDLDDAVQKHDWKSKASSAAAEVRAQAAEILAPVKEKARETAEQQKDAGAEQIGGIARAVHGAAGELERELPHAAAYVHDAAERIDRAASALRERNIDDLFHSLSDFARRQPATFFGSAVFAGFAISRFLKSSAGKQD
jgi:ribosomal protein L12E/L44/L45/RPP1/RPP2